MRTPRPIKKTEENKEKKMNSEWSLDELYKGFDDPKFAADLAKYDEMIAKINEFALPSHNLLLGGLIPYNFSRGFTRTLSSVRVPCMA